MQDLKGKTVKKEVSEASKEKEQDPGLLSVAVQNSKDIALPAHRELSDTEKLYYRGLLEAFIFLANEPLPLGLLAKQCQLDRSNTRSLVDKLADDYEERDGGFVLKEIAGGYQFITAERYSPFLQECFKEQKREKLSRASLETLAIICYQQAITLPEIDEIRGTSSRTMLSTLLQHKLIKTQGTRPVPGRPTLYVTSRNFLSHFALGSLNDLPSLKEVKELEFDSLD